MRLFTFQLCTTFSFVLAGSAFAQQAPAPVAFSDCTKIADNNSRLACFDLLAGTVAPPPAEQGQAWRPS
jgi:hypothetical protein